jgi:hypothetical protein
MRTSVLLLLLANVALFAYIQFDRWAANDDTRFKQQVNPDKIKLLTPQQVAALSPAKAAAVSNQCLDWGPFTDGERPRAQAVLEPLELGKLLTSRRIDSKSAYWVFVPPQPNKAAAEKKLAELKALGVEDLYVIQDSGPQKNAISLGVFKTEEAAHAYLDRVQKKGVKSAKSAPRAQSFSQTIFTIRDPQPAQVAKLDAAKDEFPSSELKAGACTDTP